MQIVLNAVTGIKMSPGNSSNPSNPSNVSEAGMAEAPVCNIYRRISERIPNWKKRARQGNPGSV